MKEKKNLLSEFFRRNWHAIHAAKQSFCVFMLRSREVKSRQNKLQIITITILFLELSYMHMKRNLKQFYTYRSSVDYLSISSK